MTLHGLPPAIVYGGTSFVDDGIGPVDRAVSDVNAGQDGHVLSDPHVVSDDRIALERQVSKDWA